MTPLEWAESGNPITWCAWCQEVHELTVQRDASTWTCQYGQAMQDIIDGDLAADFAKALSGLARAASDAAAACEEHEVETRFLAVEEEFREGP